MICLKEGSAGGSFSLEEQIKTLFQPNSPLLQASGFEKRPQQQAMAQAVAHALEQNQALLAEAGTGVGKSLAYLLPALAHTQATGRKAVFSTHTKNLQEQLIHKDIPLAKKILSLDLDAVVLKGRSNYLCPQRLKRLLRSSGTELTKQERTQIRTIYEWSLSTKEGQRGELDTEISPSVWQQVASEPFLCTPRTCPGSNCFYQCAKQRAEQAPVVVLNHALLFSLLSSGEYLSEDGQRNGLLFTDDFLIFDEAHTLERIAANHLGFSIVELPVLYWLKRLASESSKKGILITLDDQRGTTLCHQARLQFLQFMESLRQELPFRPPARELRLRQPVEQENTVSAAFHSLEQHLENLAELQNDDMTRRELLDLSSRLQDTRQNLEVFLNQTQEGFVYWAELQGKEADRIILRGAPVNVAEELRPMLFETGQPAIFTSATMSVGDTDLQWFKKRTGAENATSIELGSPFDYKRQMTLALTREIPPPQAEDHLPSLAAWVESLIEQTDGGALVLFTSFFHLRDCASRITQACAKANRPLLLHGSGQHTPAQLLTKFREDPRSVLFGTESFWTGIDVPGNQLRNVIITRLPFAVPGHPLTEARLELIEASGGNSFYEYSLPEATLKLKQGIGRLIRSQQDCGLAAILDSRIKSKPYGKRFLESLPQTKTIHLEGKYPAPDFSLDLPKAPQENTELESQSRPTPSSNPSDSSDSDQKESPPPNSTEDPF